jgi:membrane-bound lytic murein transglycosylase D
MLTLRPFGRLRVLLSAVERRPAQHHARYGLSGGALLLGLLLAGCATTKGTPAVAPSQRVQPASPETSTPRQPDSVDALIAVSTRHFEAGQAELEQGHLEQAKTQFNLAVDVLLESPFGARSEPRIREHFDRLVERISAYEVTALARGDGFTEKKYEPATIDDLLAISTFEKPVPTAETKQAVAEDLQTTAHDIDIPTNAKVLSYVQLFTGRLKGYLEDGLSRGARFLPMIQNVFRAEGLPLDLAYVPLIESAFKTNALSRAKAKGMWQFMRGTALENGLKHDWYIDERAEPEKATRAAAKYLKTLHRMFGGDWHLALASYNGGPGRVQRAIKRSGRDDFWRLTATTRYLPRETREYVPLILAAIIIARNPAQYGMNVSPASPMAVETVTLPHAVDLRRVAEWIGTPVDAIQELNPELRRWTTPVRAKDYDLRVPAGAADIVRARLTETSTTDLAPLRWHTVKKGETIATIARKLKVSRADLAEANYLSVRSRVTTGQQLIIPRAPELLLAARAERPAPPVESRNADSVVASVNSTPPAAKTDHTKLYHRVKRGDTLFSIAKLYKTTVASLKTWNRLRGHSIQPGQRLTIFTGRAARANN